MKTAPQKHEWTDFLQFYTEMYKGCPTRLGTFENENGTIIDYWIEDGLPLTGIDVDSSQALPSIEIMLGDLTHTVKDAKNVKVCFSADGFENGLDIVDTAGRTTILRFENGR